MKQSLKELGEKIPESKSILNIQDSAGRPRVEDKQPELLKAIIENALHGSAAHERRQDDNHSQHQVGRFCTATIRMQFNPNQLKSMIGKNSE